jgi:hypothetical protein
VNTIVKIKDNREKLEREEKLLEQVHVWKIPEKEEKKRRIHICMSYLCHLYDMIEGKKRKEISNKDESHYNKNESILPFLYKIYLNLNKLLFVEYNYCLFSIIIAKFSYCSIKYKSFFFINIYFQG